MFDQSIGARCDIGNRQVNCAPFRQTAILIRDRNIHVQNSTEGGTLLYVVHVRIVYICLDRGAMKT